MWKHFLTWIGLKRQYTHCLWSWSSKSGQLPAQAFVEGLSVMGMGWWSRSSATEPRDHLIQYMLIFLLTQRVDHFSWAPVWPANRLLPSPSCFLSQALPGLTQLGDLRQYIRKYCSCVSWCKLRHKEGGSFLKPKTRILAPCRSYLLYHCGWTLCDLPPTVPFRLHSFL